MPRLKLKLVRSITRDQHDPINTSSAAMCEGEVSLAKYNNYASAAEYLYKSDNKCRYNHITSHVIQISVSSFPMSSLFTYLRSRLSSL